MIFLILWCLPQYLIGALIYIINIKKKTLHFKRCRVCFWGKPYSMSYGPFIFLTGDPSHIRWDIVSHEYGHFMQSCYLGPFYIIIDLISTLHFLFFSKESGYKYTDFWVEKWANFLGKKFTGITPVND